MREYKQSTIEVIITGGTIDSYYEGAKDTAVPLKLSSIPLFFKLIKPEDNVFFKKVCMKDSRQLNGNDLKKIREVINKSKSKLFIVTHGTYTMPDTARFLATNLKRKDCTVILTGSMIPLTGFAPSDAPFNLGYSFAMVKTLKPGIYVCMNGRIFDPMEVAKRISAGKFVSVLGEN